MCLLQSAPRVGETGVHFKQYHLYTVVATMSDSRVWGHEAKLRPHRDTEPDLVIIPDPTQTALSDGTIRSWQAFSYIVNVDYRVYFQVSVSRCECNSQGIIINRPSVFLVGRNNHVRTCRVLTQITCYDNEEFVFSYNVRGEYFMNAGGRIIIEYFIPRFPKGQYPASELKRNLELPASHVRGTVALMRANLSRSGVQPGDGWAVIPVVSKSIITTAISTTVVPSYLQNMNSLVKPTFRPANCVFKRFRCNSRTTQLISAEVIC